ncbi:MAG: hypothetical protein HQL10_00900 [Nitrospirae bacterium]|nr:hypothetical protein [Nitrospirota bacterium]
MGKIIRNERGMAILIALTVMLLILVIAGASMTISQLGYMSVGSEQKYQLATAAAEYALNAGVAAAATCSPTSTSGSLTGGASYSYFGRPDNSSTYCFVYGKGQMGTASIIRVTVVPMSTSDVTALVANNISNETFNGDNSAISSNGCGSAVIYESCGFSNCSTTISTESHFIGEPKAQQKTIDDMTSKLFNASSWSDLVTQNIAAAATLNSSVPAACKFYSSNATTVANTTCTTINNSGDIRCETSGGGTTNILASSNCTTVLITAAQVTINDTQNQAPDMFVYASETLSVGLSGNQPTLSGYFCTGTSGETSFNMSGSGGFTGILATARASNITLSGNTTSEGLIFVGNSGTETPNVTINGNDKMQGAMVFNGNVEITRNGGGTAYPNIEYSADQINAWKSKFGGSLLSSLIKTASCGGGSLSSATSRTKTTVY